MYMNVYRPLRAAVPAESFNGFVDSLFGDVFPPLRATDDRSLPTVAARFDVIDRADRFDVTLEMPGVAKEDIDVQIDGARVNVRAQSKTEQTVNEGERVLHTERRSVTYVRSFELPAEVARDRVEATYENGVLRLALPKRIASEARRIEVR